MTTLERKILNGTATAEESREYLILEGQDPDKLVEEGLAFIKKVQEEINSRPIMFHETKWMKQLLPDHYICEPRHNGVHCYSDKGIDENDPEQWHYTVEAIKQKFGDRLLEIYHQICTNHVKFTVFLKVNPL